MNTKAAGVLLMAGGLALAAALAGCEGSMTGGPAPGTPPRVVGLGARCADVAFPIYFQDGSDQLTPQARQVLASNVAHVRGCQVLSGEIVGLASAGGSAQTADVLSQRRAVRVAEALAAAGVPGPALELKAAGEEGAVAPNGHAAPLRHAAQVFLHFRRS